MGRTPRAASSTLSNAPSSGAVNTAGSSASAVASLTPNTTQAVDGAFPTPFRDQQWLASTSATERAASRPLSKAVTLSPVAPRVSSPMPSSSSGQLLTARLKQAMYALAANQLLTTRRAAKMHRVPRLTLSRQLAMHRVPGMHTSGHSEDFGHQREGHGKQRESNPIQREYNGKQHAGPDEQRRRPVTTRRLTFTEERQLASYLGTLSDMGLDPDATMVDEIVAKLVASRDDSSLANKEGTEPWSVRFLRTWGLCSRFGLKEVDDREVDNLEDCEGVYTEIRAAAFKGAIMDKLSGLFESEKDPENFKLHAIRLGMFAGEAKEYQAMLEHALQVQHTTLMGMQACHYTGCDDSEAGDEVTNEDQYMGAHEGDGGDKDVGLADDQQVEIDEDDV